MDTEGPKIADLATAFRPYLTEMRDFASGRMSAETFEKTFRESYLAGTEDFTDEVFDVIDGYFARVEAYTDAPRPDPAWMDVSEEQLLEYTRDMLRRLDEHG